MSTAQAQYTIGQTVFLDPNSITVDETSNTRYYGTPKTEALARKILAQDVVQGEEANDPSGQLQPVKIDEDGSLKFGFRRVAAIKYINEHLNGNVNATKWPHGFLVRAEVISRNLSKLDLFLMNISENEDREDPSPVDRAHTMYKMAQPVEEGGFAMSQGEIAAKLSEGGSKTSQTVVSQSLKMVREAPAWALKMVHEGKVGMVALMEALRYPVESEERKAALEALKTGAASRKVREAAEGDGDGEGGDAVTPGKTKKKARTVKEIKLFLEGEAYTEEGVEGTAYTEVCGAMLNYVTGKKGSRTLKAVLQQHLG